jgi:DNA-binding response OmpR family regulator
MPLSILLIDDSPGECELFRLAMTQARFKGQLIVRHDRLGAWERLNEHSPNNKLALILLDLHLRGERGLDVLKELKQHRRYALLPIVMLTNSDDRREIVACYQAGANGYVVKPDRFDDLVTLSLHLWKFWIEYNCTCGLDIPC